MVDAVKGRVWAVLCLLLFVGGVSAQPPDDDNALQTLLVNVPQHPAISEMIANRISYADYRALERASGLPELHSLTNYEALSDGEKQQWSMARLRLHTGPNGFNNLVTERLAAMPDLIGVDFFAVDAALTYGYPPFTADIMYSRRGQLLSVSVSGALQARDYERRIVATGSAWGLGGDGMTDFGNVQTGDPFGGDVGLSSRVAVFDPYTLANASIWGILFASAEAHREIQPSFASDDAYQSAAAFIHANDDATLIQALMVSPIAGLLQTPHESLPLLPTYQMAVLTDHQRNTEQIASVTLFYADADDAALAAEMLSGHMAAYDTGWLEQLGYETPTVTQADAPHGFTAVVYQAVAPAATPTEMLTGASEPGVIFGFWVTAVERETFFPLATTLDG
jgi:hypothetical protein